MRNAAVVIVIHQVLFQGMFCAKNILIRRRLGTPIRGKNPEANRAVVFFGVLILCAVILGLFDAPFGSVDVLPNGAATGIALALLAVNLAVAASSLVGLGDSWRVGVLEDQETDLIESGIYRFSRNPYFLSYLVMFVAYTVLLQSLIFAGLTLIGFSLVHAMVLKEEEHLAALHGESYRRYRKRVPRYLLI